MAVAAVRSRASSQLAGFAPAALADWTFVRVTGLVWVVKEGMEPMRAEVGMVLPDSATVGTTSKARAMLKQGEDMLNIAPSTSIAPQARKVRGLATVLMRKGGLELEIEKLGGPHFAVQTPFLAAVVKGTHFTVSVSGSGAEVSVARGRVGVTDFAAGERADIVAGQRPEPEAPGWSCPAPETCRRSRRSPRSGLPLRPLKVSRPSPAARQGRKQPPLPALRPRASELGVEVHCRRGNDGSGDGRRDRRQHGQ